MSRVFSFRDLKLIPELVKYNEIELLHPTMDRVVYPYLGMLGFDLDYAIEYIPAKHRDLQGNVGVGFRAVGEISINRSFINSRLCSTTERMIAAFHSDPGLAKELAQLMGSSISLRNDSEGEEDVEFPQELVETDFNDVIQQIRNLEKIRDTLRCSCRNENGALKTPREILPLE